MGMDPMLLLNVVSALFSSALAYSIYDIPGKDLDGHGTFLFVLNAFCAFFNLSILLVNIIQ